MAVEREHLVFSLEGSSFGPRHLNVYLQHSGDPKQSTGIMLMDGGKIILGLPACEIERFISELSARWQGKKPEGIP